MCLKIRKFSCVRAHRGNLINYMRTDTKRFINKSIWWQWNKTVRLRSDRFI